MKYSYIILLIILTTVTLFADDWEFDISNCTQVTERFYFNGVENIDNSPINRYYNQNNDLVLRILYNRQGQERNRNIYLYNELNELIEYSLWNRLSNGRWNRWQHGIIEKSIVNDIIIFTEKRQSYFEDYKIVKITKTTLIGKLISIEVIDEEDYNYSEFNINGDLIYNVYENEKSNGRQERNYEIIYDINNNKIEERIIGYNELLTLIKYHYDKYNKLIKKEIIYIPNNGMTYIYYKYDENSVIEERYLNNDNIETFFQYYEYDINRRIIKRGEKTNSYERWWTYEY